MSFLVNPEKHNRPFTERAREAAKTFGEGFVVFVGSMAVLGTARQESAQDEARKWAAANGRQNVRIKRIKSTKITGTAI